MAWLQALHRIMVVGGDAAAAANGHASNQHCSMPFGACVVVA